MEPVRRRSGRPRTVTVPMRHIGAQMTQPEADAFHQACARAGTTASEVLRNAAKAFTEQAATSTEQERLPLTG